MKFSSCSQLFQLIKKELTDLIANKSGEKMKSDNVKEIDITAMALKVLAKKTMQTTMARKKSKKNEILKYKLLLL